MIGPKKIIFVHGFGVSAPTEVTDWPNWLARETKKIGFAFQALSMPDPMNPEVNEWLDFLNKQNIVVDENTYFVGHSLGCITIARFLEKLPSENIAGSCIFISGFCSLPAIPLLSKFCTLPLDFSKVQKHSRDFVVVISDNDTFIPPSSSKEFAEKLGARIIIEHNKGHFVTGTKEIRSVLNTIIELDKMREEMTEIEDLRRYNRS